MMSNVSVVIPVHNGVRFIKKALTSALIQDGVQEIIVVDDASSDGTYELVKRLQAVVERKEDTKRIVLISNPTNCGAAFSRNKGVQKAKGRYVAFLDCDDWWQPGKIRRQVQLLEETGSVLCCTGRRLVSADGRKLSRTIGVDKRISYDELLKHNQINCSSVLMSRSLALEYPMMHEETHEDYLTWLKILRDRGDACGIDEPLLNYRVSSSGKSGSKLKSARMTYNVYRCLGLSLPQSIRCFIMYALNGVYKYYHF